MLRYTYSITDNWVGNLQGAYVYQTSSEPLLRIVDQQHLGTLPAFGVVDVSGGAERNNLSINLYIKNLTDERSNIGRFGQCTPTTCTQITSYRRSRGRSVSCSGRSC